MSDYKIESSDLERLLGEIQSMPSDEHIPEEVLRAYLAQEEIEAEIEEHLIDCMDCQTLADGILAETSVWKVDPEHSEQLKASVLARVQSRAPRYLERLQTALEKLAAAREDLRAALTGWKDGLVGGYRGTEATVRADISHGLSVLEEFSGHGLQADYSGAQGGVRGLEGAEEASAGASSVVLSTDRLSAVQVRLEEGAIEVMFLDWDSATPPLVILLPETETDEAWAMLGQEDSSTGLFVARFADASMGSFLLTIASPDELAPAPNDSQPK